MTQATLPDIDVESWPPKLNFLKGLDDLIRCPICFDYLKAAMILPNCDHNYCSLCIRKYFTHKEQCPMCTCSASSNQLRNNRILDRIILQFQTIRQPLLMLSNGNVDCEESNERWNMLETASNKFQAITECDNVALYQKNSCMATKRLGQKSDSDDSDIEILAEYSNSSSSAPYTATSSSQQPSPALKSQNTVNNAKSKTVQSNLLAHLALSKNCVRFPARMSDIGLKETRARETEKSNSEYFKHSTKRLSLPLKSGDKFSKPLPSVKTVPAKTSSFPVEISRASQSQPSSSSFSAADPVDFPVLKIQLERQDSIPTNGASKMDAVPCPVCGAQVNSRVVNQHLDMCLASKKSRESLRAHMTEKRKPLPKLVYNLLSDKDIRKRLRELGLSSDGDRQVLIKRHRDFTMFYNADLDSLAPKDMGELVKEFEDVQKLQKKLDTKASASSSQPVLRFTKDAVKEDIEKACKDYAMQHKTQFQSLIKQIRSRMKTCTDSQVPTPSVTEIVERRAEQQPECSLEICSEEFLQADSNVPVISIINYTSDHQASAKFEEGISHSVCSQNYSTESSTASALFTQAGSSGSGILNNDHGPLQRKGEISLQPLESRCKDKENSESVISSDSEEAQTGISASKSCRAPQSPLQTRLAVDLEIQRYQLQCGPVKSRTQSSSSLRISQDPCSQKKAEDVPNDEVQVSLCDGNKKSDSCRTVSEIRNCTVLIEAITVPLSSNNVQCLTDSIGVVVSRDNTDSLNETESFKRTRQSSSVKFSKHPPKSQKGKRKKSESFSVSHLVALPGQSESVRAAICREPAEANGKKSKKNNSSDSEETISAQTGIKKNEWKKPERKDRNVSVTDRNNQDSSGDSVCHTETPSFEKEGVGEAAAVASLGLEGKDRSDSVCNSETQSFEKEGDVEATAAAASLVYEGREVDQPTSTLEVAACQESVTNATFISETSKLAQSVENKPGGFFEMSLSDCEEDGMPFSGSKDSSIPGNLSATCGLVKKSMKRKGKKNYRHKLRSASTDHNRSSPQSEAVMGSLLAAQDDQGINTAEQVTKLKSLMKKRHESIFKFKKSVRFSGLKARISNIITESPDKKTVAKHQDCAEPDDHFISYESKLNKDKMFQAYRKVVRTKNLRIQQVSIQPAMLETNLLDHTQFETGKTFTEVAQKKRTRTKASKSSGKHKKALTIMTVSEDDSLSTSSCSQIFDKPLGSQEDKSLKISTSEEASISEQNNFSQTVSSSSCKESFQKASKPKLKMRRCRKSITYSLQAAAESSEVTPKLTSGDDCRTVLRNKGKSAKRKYSELKE